MAARDPALKSKLSDRGRGWGGEALCRAEPAVDKTAPQPCDASQAVE